jgi:hypothetical protein
MGVAVFNRDSISAVTNRHTLVNCCTSVYPGGVAVSNRDFSEVENFRTLVNPSNFQYTFNLFQV